MPTNEELLQEIERLKRIISQFVELLEHTGCMVSDIEDLKSFKDVKKQLEDMLK